MAKNTSPEIWKQKATEVEHLMRNGVRGEPRLVESLGYLSSLMYPLEGLQKQVKILCNREVGGGVAL